MTKKSLKSMLACLFILTGYSSSLNAVSTVIDTQPITPTTSVVVPTAPSVVPTAPEVKKSISPSDSVKNGKLTEKYENKENKYSIEYPAGWEKKTVPNLDLVLLAPPEGPSMQPHATINTLSENTGTPVTLDQFYTESLANLPTALKEFQNEGSGNRDLNGVSSKWVLYSHTMQGNKFHVLQYFIVVKDTIYLLTFSTTADAYEDYKQLFENVASSFKPLQA